MCTNKASFQHTLEEWKKFYKDVGIAVTQTDLNYIAQAGYMKETAIQFFLRQNLSDHYIQDGDELLRLTELQQEIMELMANQEDSHNE